MDNFKAALRSLISTPGPTLVVVATLAIVIGANTAIFSVVDGVLLRPLGYGDDDRIMVLWTTNASNEGNLTRLSPADYRDVRDGIESFDGQVVLYRSIGSTLTGLDQPARIGSYTVTARMFDVLSATPAVGQFFTDEDEIPGGEKKVVLTHASWVRRFGADPALVGSTIEMDSAPYTVVGVAEEGFTFPPGNDEVEAYFPMGLSDAVLMDRNHRMFDAVARLSEGTTLDDARAELSLVAARIAEEYPTSNTGWGLTANPLRAELLGDIRTTLWVLSASVFLVLLIACANIANVLVARSASSGREFAVRAALGARTGDLFKRSLADSAILGLVGTALGLFIAYWGVALLRRVIPGDIPRGTMIGVDASVLLFVAALSVGATVLFGSLPALRNIAPNLHDLLKPAKAFGSAATGGRRLRELMVVVEVALAIVLLVGAGLMVKSFGRLSEVDPGFRQEGVVSVAVQLPGARYNRAEWLPFFEQLVERVGQLPGVRVAGAISDLPMSDVGLGFELEFQLPGLDIASDQPYADVRLTVPGYFEAMDMEIVRGRRFDSLDATSERNVAIVNETLAERYFKEIDYVGRSIQVQNMGDVEIVGIVSDIRHSGLQSKYESEIFIPYGRFSTREMHVVVQSDLDTPAVASAVGDVLTDIDPQLAPTRVDAISDLLWESVAVPRFNTALLAVLAFSAAILAIVGTYGIVAFSVSRRTTEIGVRMALGANAGATVAMIVRHALGIVLVGSILGVLGALGATRFLGELLFDVRPSDPATYAWVLAASLVVGTVAAWMPARRAARVDPVVALRDE